MYSAATNLDVEAMADTLCLGGFAPKCMTSERTYSHSVEKFLASYDSVGNIATQT